MTGEDDMSCKPRPAVMFRIEGPPKTKENKGQFNKGFYFKKHSDIVDWEVSVNHQAIAAMRDRGWPGPYKGRCEITAAQTYESWKRCDITNYWKSLNDALNGATWVDDSQVDAAKSVRFVNRDTPGVLVMIWFYDFSFEEEFGTGKYSKAGNQIMKYPDTYAIFDAGGFDYKPNVGYVSKPEESPSKRFGVYVRMPTREEREKAKKASKQGTKTQSKPNRKRTVPNDQAKAESNGKPSRRKTGTTGKASTGRRSKRS